MEIIGLILIIMGLLIAVFYGVIILIKAFQAHILWGLAYLFIPFASLVFVFTHWDETGKPFLYTLGGTFLCVVGAMLGGFFGTA